MSDRKNESSIKAFYMSTVGHAHIVAAEQNRVDDLGTNCRLEQRITAECFFNEFFKFLNLRLVMFKLMVILNQLGMPTCCQLTVYKFCLSKARGNVL